MADQPQPDTLGEAQRRMAGAVTRCRDVYAGTNRMREKGETYLPQFPREKAGAYRTRLAQAVLHNAFKRTAEGLTGMVYRNDPEPGDDVPPEIAGHLENVDLRGRDLATFGRAVLQSSIIDGHADIVVDWSVREPGAIRSLSDERAAGARPYWTLVKKGDVVRAWSEAINGKLVLTRYAYRETVAEQTGPFTREMVLRIRDYELVPGPAVEYTVWAKRENEKQRAEWVVDEAGTLDGISRIPVATSYAGRTGFMESAPPLHDLAHLNILHYQLWSDRINVLHVASVPIPTFGGLQSEEGDRTVGPNNGIVLPADGWADYLEPDGNGLEEVRLEMGNIERLMATQGLSQLYTATRAPETATSKRIDKSENDSQLATTARSHEQALNEALEIHGEWMGVAESGEIATSTDFEALTLDPQMVKRLHELVATGDISQETLWSALERGEVLPPGFDPEEESLRLQRQLGPPGIDRPAEVVQASRGNL